MSCLPFLAEWTTCCMSSLSVTKVHLLFSLLCCIFDLIQFSVYKIRQQNNSDIPNQTPRFVACANPEWGAWGPDPTPLKNHKDIGFRGNTGPDPLKFHKANKTAFNRGPLSARQRNAIEMAFRWRADDNPLIVAFANLVGIHSKYVYPGSFIRDYNLITLKRFIDHTHTRFSLSLKLLTYSFTLYHFCVVRLYLLSLKVKNVISIIKE